MKLLGDDDLNLREATWEELEAAWDFWFDLAQHTNDHDPPYTRGGFVRLRAPREEGAARTAPSGPGPVKTPRA